MSITVRIENLKNIQKLDFDLPTPGAYLLTGSNGSGKTTLLTCLNRLKNKNAFQIGLKSSIHKSLDSHQGAEITYVVNNDSVTYKYAEERWSPTPRRNSSLLSSCGYPEVIYIAADADRVEPKKQEFSPRKVRPAPQSIKGYLNDIFATGKFNELCYINLIRSGQTKAYLIRQSKPNKPASYYSEKNFSLGELCALKLLLELENVKNDSLILIDELELAIHPKAQARLFNHLKAISSAKNLTIIFSTHSVSLIKSVSRSNLIFLKNSNGNIETLKGCYPTYALGQITSGEELAPDCIVYVEDNSAKRCIEAMIRLYNSKVNAKVAKPTTVAIPLGGFRQILEFIDKAPQILPITTKVVAALDQDVQTESLVNYQENQEFDLLALFDRTKNKVKYLPWTPELGLVDLLTEDLQKHEDELKNFLQDHRICIPQGWPEVGNPQTNKQKREQAKRNTYALCHHIQIITGKSNDKVREDMFEYLVYATEAKNMNSMISLAGTLIHS